MKSALLMLAESLTFLILLWRRIKNTKSLFILQSVFTSTPKCENEYSVNNCSRQNYFLAVYP